MKDLGEINTYLGININYECEKGKMTLDQKDYIVSLGKKYDIVNTKLYATPMEQNLKLEPAQSACDEIKYRNLIGALLYISSGTRPDVSFSVNYLSRFQNCYDNTHYKYALRVLKYLVLTKDLKLTFDRNLNAEILDCHVDADWAGDITDRKSTTGYVIKMYGNKQNSVTKSSTSAEYVALSECASELKVVRDILLDFNVKLPDTINVYEDECASELKVVRDILLDFNVKLPDTINVYEDNSGAVNIAKFGNFKYIETHYHFVNESYLSGINDIVKVDSEENVADILTKPLSRNKFEKCRDNLNVK
ncbi:hypothetical protein QE152_g29523 [Popillia japonica]|uniref:Polyprotein n=1 Tax=Popillia japonica TaxID=7064 RepID=A0AAW1JHG9_POPJA